MRLFILLFLFSPFLLKAQTGVLTVYFDHDKDQLNSREQNKITELLKEYQIFYITSFDAYCDSLGSKEYNFDLAQRRLKSVKGFFSESQIKYSEFNALGENYPDSNSIAPLKNWRKVEIHYGIEHIKTQDIVEMEAKEPVNQSVFDDLTLEDVLADDAEPIVLDIQFFPGMDVLMNDSWGEIDRLFLFLKKNDKVHAFIRGHVCCGSDMYLSYARAYAIYNSMIKRGISPKRLDLKGFDNTKPRVWPEVTDEDRQMNRRVDVIFSLPEE